MSQVMFWMLGIAFSAAGMVMTVALNAHVGQFALALVIVAFIVLSGIRDHARRRADGANPSHCAAVLARHLGVLWSWTAVALMLIYTTLLVWPAWLSVFILLVLGAGLCFVLASVLDRDADQDQVDVRMIEAVSLIAKTQFAASCVSVGGLLAYGNFSASAFGGDAKWAAMNVLLVLSLSLGFLSAFAVVYLGPDAETEPTEPTARHKRAGPQIVPRVPQRRAARRAVRA